MISGINFKKGESPNRGGKINPKVIVIHWTAGSFNSAVNWFLNPQAQASAHFILSKDGLNLTQMVELNKVAWHAGGKSWHPVFGQNLNMTGIGIELEGPPSITKLPKWDERQISSLIELCKHLKHELPTIQGITDHCTIFPGRKIDVLGATKPSDIFPWDKLISETGLTDFSTKEMRQKSIEHFGMGIGLK
jgi:N-acetyl-anhydromuramyl-L-alanine amidase AmpD